MAQAWQENLGDYPGSQEFRDFVLSTSDDRGYEPFVQGGGWFNASRAVSTLEGENGTWWASPAQWNSGTFQGEHRDANLNLMRPGDSQLVEIEFTNYADSDVHLRYTPIRFSPLAHEVVVWNSTGNGSDEGDENGSWDGHQGDRPDLLIPLHIESDPNFHLPHGTRQLRARATIDYSNFDGNQDRSSEERVFLQIYRWTDEDGDGTQQPGVDFTLGYGGVRDGEGWIVYYDKNENGIRDPDSIVQALRAMQPSQLLGKGGGELPASLSVVEVRRAAPPRYHPLM